MDKNMDFYGDVIARLRTIRHCDLKLVAQQSGVPEGTLRKVFYGEVSNPRVQTVQALHNYFTRLPLTPENSVQGGAASVVHAASAGIKANRSDIDKDVTSARPTSATSIAQSPDNEPTKCK